MISNRLNHAVRVFKVSLLVLGALLLVAGPASAGKKDKGGKFEASDESCAPHVQAAIRAVQSEIAEAEKEAVEDAAPPSKKAAKKAAKAAKKAAKKADAEAKACAEFVKKGLEDLKAKVDAAIGGAETAAAE
jgi:hypothetical protein